MEVKIGVQYAPRELVLESAQTPDEVQAAVSRAVSEGSGVLELQDEKGRRVIIPTKGIAYVEIAESESRRVGFGA